MGDRASNWASVFTLTVAAHLSLWKFRGISLILQYGRAPGLLAPYRQVRLRPGRPAVRLLFWRRLHPQEHEPRKGSLEPKNARKGRDHVAYIIFSRHVELTVEPTVESTVEPTVEQVTRVGVWHR